MTNGQFEDCRFPTTSRSRQNKVVIGLICRRVAFRLYGIEGIKRENRSEAVWKVTSRDQLDTLNDRRCMAEADLRLDWIRNK